MRTKKEILETYWEKDLFNSELEELNSCLYNLLEVMIDIRNVLRLKKK